MSKILLEHVTVEIPIYNLGDRSLKVNLFRSARDTSLLRSAGGAIGRDRRNRVIVRALDDVSLELNDGDHVALLGRNGAGKTTLLRVMADVVEPVTGKINVSGRVSTLFNVSGLMDPELSGYENILFAGGLLGVPRNRLKIVMAEIEALAELGDFLQMPVRAYSSGMLARLGFAIATSIEPDILLIDEVIGAGDDHFVTKAIRRAQELYHKSSIVVVASHSRELLEGLCTKAILLDRGKIVTMGPLDAVFRQYELNDKVE